MTDLIFKKPSLDEFEMICRLIDEYALDNRNLVADEFSIVLKNGKIAGFGRLKKHKDCLELCSVGILKAHRNSGIGNELIKHILQQTQEPIYVVSIIPEYFQRFGFTITTQVPDVINSKIQYCTNELPVPENYTAMVLKK